MPWTTPVNRATNDVVTAAQWNAQLGATGNIQYLYEGDSIYKRKSAAQSFVTTTSFVDITANPSGNMSFPIAANEVWVCEWRLNIIANAAGGSQWQVTGPASPTQVIIGGGYQVSITDGAGVGWIEDFAAASAFSTVFISVAGGLTPTTQRNGGMRFSAFIANGSNAGTVALQGAQNNATGTTSISGTGAYMIARRLRLAA